MGTKMCSYNEESLYNVDSFELLKGNGALGGHVTKFGYDGTKKFLDPDLVYKISVIRILARVRTLEKLD